jgi:hypothetical protein
MHKCQKRPSKEAKQSYSSVKEDALYSYTCALASLLRFFSLVVFSWSFIFCLSFLGLASAVPGALWAGFSGFFHWPLALSCFARSFISLFFISQQSADERDFSAASVHDKALGAHVVVC